MPSQNVTVTAHWLFQGSGWVNNNWTDNNIGGGGNDSFHMPDTGIADMWVFFLRNDIQRAAYGDTVTLPTGDNTSIPAEIFEAVRSKNLTLVLRMDNCTWTIDGSTIQPATGDIDLGLSIIKNARLSALAEGADVVQFTISHSGALPFDATLSLNLTDAYSDTLLYLYYYNATAGNLEYRMDAYTDERGVISLSFSHASTYVLTIREIEIKAPTLQHDSLQQASLQLNQWSPPVDGVKPFIIVGEAGSSTPGYGAVSARVFGNFIGAQVEWTGTAAVLTGTNGLTGEAVVVIMVPGETTGTINGVAYDIGEYSGSVPAGSAVVYVTSDGRIYLPMRFLTTAFGNNLEWDAETATATIHR
jgi:hypothetical protein